MLNRLGYACICLSIEATTNKGTILRNATPERIRELIAVNLRGLEEIIAFNARNDVLLFRMSSEIVPFGGHPVNTVPWWEEFGAELAAVGAAVRAAGMRVSMHPGQYTLLSSADERITENAIRDLLWHARFLETMGLDTTHRLVIHGGGAYGDKPAAIARWVERYRALPELIAKRLVIENDERVYSVDDVLQISAATGVPVVLDTLHYALNPGERGRSLGDAITAAFGTWGPEDGPPKMHFSSQAAAKRPGAHADDADFDEFLDFLAQTPARPFDVMLETKSKDLSLFSLREHLAARGIIEASRRTASAA